MHRTNIYLEPAQCEALDRLAAEEGTSRAEMIRRLLNRAMAGRDEDLKGDLTAIAESAAVLADAEPLAREHDERSAHLDDVWRIGA